MEPGLIIGALLVLVGLWTPFWSMFGLDFSKESRWSEGRTITTIIRLGAFITGSIILAVNFPDIVQGVSNPGWTVMGLIFSLVSGLPSYWNQFSLIHTDKNGDLDDKDALISFMIVRTIGLAGGIGMLAVGIGTGVPGWN